MNKFYDLYNNFEKDQIYISTIRNIIANDLSMKDVKGVVNQKAYERLIEKKTLAREDDLKLWKSMLRTIYKIDDEDKIKRLLNNLAPYFRNKLRPFF